MNWDSQYRKILKKVVINGVTYFGEDIVEIKINDSIIEENTLQIGSAISVRCELKLKIEGEVERNAKVVPFISLENQDWVQLGEFYIDSRARNGSFLNLVCFDKLYLANKQFATNTNLKMNGRIFVNPTTITEIFNDVCRILEVNTDVTIIENFPTSFIYEISDYSFTVRDVLKKIASTQGANAKIDKQGVLTFIRFEDEVVKTITQSLHSKASETNAKKEISHIVIDEDSEFSYTLGSGERKEILKLKNRWLFRTATNWNNLLEGQIPISYMPLSLKYRGDPNLNVGDRINVRLKDGSVVSTYILRTQLNIKIGLSQEIESPSDTVLESEFGKFSIIDEIKDQINDLIDDTSHLRDTYTVTISGNAVEGEHYTISVDDNAPLSSVPYMSYVRINAVKKSDGKYEEIYINGTKVFIMSMFRVTSDMQLNITVESPWEEDMQGVSKIWIESYEPSDEGEDGDLWVVI